MMISKTILSSQIKNKINKNQFKVLNMILTEFMIPLWLMMIFFKCPLSNRKIHLERIIEMT